MTKRGLWAAACLCCLLSSPLFAASADPQDKEAGPTAADVSLEAAPIRVVEVTPITLPFNATRASWEQTKEMATAHWRAIPFAQLAAALLFVKTAVSTPYDLAAAPFRQNTRSEVRFELKGRIVDSGGKPASNARLLVRCTAPWDVEPASNEYYETARFGPIAADADGRVELSASAVTGLAPKLTLHLDMEEGPKGSASAGAYSIVLTTAGPTISEEMTGSLRLIAAP